MDLNIQIKDGLIATSLYAKPLVLYRYIPPSSCHPPDVLTGLVLGQVLRVYQLCSKRGDIDRELYLFHTCLIDCGYQLDELLPLFVRGGVDNAVNYLLLTPAQQVDRKKAKIGNMDKRIFFLITYHPRLPPSKVTQQLWRVLVFAPPGEKTFNQLKNSSGHHVPIKRLIVAYHQLLNLANLLLYRKLDTCTRLKDSLFIGMIL